MDLLIQSYIFVGLSARLLRISLDRIGGLSLPRGDERQDRKEAVIHSENSGGE